MMEVAEKEIEFNKYSEYKDSGVEWLGDIPEHWGILPGFAFILERSEKNVGMKESRVLSLSYGNVIVKPEEKLTGLVPESFETYQLVYPGDIIIRPTDLQNDKTSLRTGIAKDKGIITSAYMNLSVKEDNSNKYYHYLFHSIDTNKVLYGLGSGLRQNLSYEDFKRFQFPIPTPEEQTAIANFLDEKTAKIDEAISIKQRQIELLKERRQVLIHKAVTRGLNPEVPLKPSGVDWIGDIPEHWEVKRLKYILNEINIRSKTGEEELLSLSKYYGVIPKSTLEERAGMAESLVGYKIVKPGNIVINKMQAVNGLIGVSKLSGLTSPDYSIYTTKSDFNDEYYGVLLKQPKYLSEYSKVVTGVMEGFIRLYTDDLFSIYTHVPPLEEQVQIVNYLEKIHEKFDKVLNQIEMELDSLSEYKVTMINNAVTGKIKVSLDAKCDR